MSVSIQKAALRKNLLERRDETSADLRDISSKKIHQNLKQINAYNTSQNIACYFPIGSEVNTQEIMLDILEKGKNLLLPRITENDIVFHIITNLEKLEEGDFGIMEPRNDYKKAVMIDCILVPTIAISKSGIRLGYGKGYYDRFLSTTKAVKISLTYSKQIIKSIPNDAYDIKMDWIVTEDEIIKTR